jgi:hypothetical protein
MDKYSSEKSVLILLMTATEFSRVSWIFDDTPVMLAFPINARNSNWSTGRLKSSSAGESLTLKRCKTQWLNSTRSQSMGVRSGNI